jgi:hypothetical protein
MSPLEGSCSDQGSEGMEMINHVINSPARIIITAITASTESQTNSLVRSGLLGKWGIQLRARSSPADMAQTLHSAPFDADRSRLQSTRWLVSGPRVIPPHQRTQFDDQAGNAGPISQPEY